MCSFVDYVLVIFVVQKVVLGFFKLPLRQKKSDSKNPRIFPFREFFPRRVCGKKNKQRDGNWIVD